MARSTFVQSLTNVNYKLFRKEGEREAGNVIFVLRSQSFEQQIDFRDTVRKYYS